MKKKKIISYVSFLMLFSCANNYQNNTNIDSLSSYQESIISSSIENSSSSIYENEYDYFCVEENVQNILNKIDAEQFNNIYSRNINEDQVKEIKEDLIKNNINLYKEDKEELAKDLFTYIHKNYHYGENDNSPYTVFTLKSGVCQGFAELYKVILNIANIPSLIVNGNTSFGGHAWNLVYFNHSWNAVDTINGAFALEENKDFFSSFEIYFIDETLFEVDEKEYCYNRGLSLKKYRGNETKLIIDEEINGIKITSFCDFYLQEENKYVQEIVLPSNTEIVEKNYFKIFPYLEDISIENNQKYQAKNGILYENKNLLYIPYMKEDIKLDYLEIYDKGVITNLNNVKTIYLSNNAKRIESYAFENLNNLQDVYFYDDIEYIAKDAFYNVNKFTVHTNNQIIKEYALNTNLSVVEI